MLRQMWLRNSFFKLATSPEFTEKYGLKERKGKEREGKERKGKGREGKGRKGKEREGKGSILWIRLLRLR